MGNEHKFDIDNIVLEGVTRAISQQLPKGFQLRAKMKFYGHGNWGDHGAYGFELIDNDWYYGRIASYTPPTSAEIFAPISGDLVILIGKDNIEQRKTGKLEIGLNTDHGRPRIPPEVLKPFRDNGIDIFVANIDDNRYREAQISEKELKEGTQEYESQERCVGA